MTPGQLQLLMEIRDGQKNFAPHLRGMRLDAFQCVVRDLEALRDGGYITMNKPHKVSTGSRLIDKVSAVVSTEMGQQYLAEQ